jgi:hypothetical protein
MMRTIRWVAIAWLSASLGCGGGGNSAGTGGAGGGGAGGGGVGGQPPAPDMASGPPPAVLTPRNAVNLFLSGHSLINLDMPWNVQQVAMANGQMHHYNEQMGIGSNMATRIMGGNEQDAAGMRVTFQVLSEIRNAQTLPGGRKYDTLIITEASNISSQVRSSNTVGHSRSFYDALIASAPQGRVFLYDSWDASGGNIPGWVAKIRRDYLWYECVASAVNKDPARSSNPMLLLPAGMMLARAAEAVMAGQIPGVSSPAGLLLADGHHASDLGNYLLAITVYASIYGRTPEVAAVAPTTRFGRAYGLPGGAVAALRDLAWSTLGEFYRSGHNNRRSMAECRQRLAQMCDGTSICPQDVNRIFAD